jgi:hypothetical protein
MLTILQSNIQQQQDNEAKKRKDLHDRLEGMVSDVEDALHSKEQAKTHSETFETDEL